MTALHHIISVSFVAVPAYGCGKGDTTKPKPCPTTMKPTPCPTTMKPTPCPTTMKPTPCATTIKPTSTPSPRDVKKLSGEFVYERSRPARTLVRVAFLVPYDSSSGMFSVEYADGTAYQTAWFDLHPNTEDPASIHPASGRDAHNAWLAGIRTACPDGERGDITERDFESFVVDGDGNAQAVFEGMGLGKAYRLTPWERGETLHDVVSGLKGKCPDLPEEYFSVEKWETVRFASRSELFVTGDYVLDGARNTNVMWFEADSLS
ncbi:hypothetical protein FOZ63_026090 [Perkinsus olseni]|uniref:Uncharacterized protein n=1 Tax=Perkinsus olseni TaxID=32597 RepID=A0A7J6RNL9_PEROL|nr:hypothetical protein FOZ62_007520 [Perkinsus olseni]KAF4721290.1 hypothetical protein FOZ63_026090 [Perkinsus olseni]